MLSDMQLSVVESMYYIGPTTAVLLVAAALALEVCSRRWQLRGLGQILPILTVNARHGHAPYLYYVMIENGNVHTAT